MAITAGLTPVTHSMESKRSHLIHLIQFDSDTPSASDLHVGEESKLSVNRFA